MSNETTNGVKTMNVACIISNSGIINVTIDGKPFSIAPDHLNYKSVAKAIKDNDVEKLVNLVDIPKAVSTYTAGAVSIADGAVLYDGQTIHGAIATRILGLMQEDMPFKFMVNFLGNLMQNPSHRAVNELYDFLEFAKIPITDDGCFLAYKRVREDYKDIHSGTVDNSVGQKPWMRRNEVDEDKNRTCSTGYHFCSLDYIPNFGSSQDNSTDRVMIVKINPKDVVAIPADYNNTKGRCCEYEVVAEYDGDWRKDAFTQSVYRKDGTPYELEAEDEPERDTSCPKCGAELDEDGICPECLYDENVCQDCGSELDGGFCPNCDGDEDDEQDELDSADDVGDMDEDEESSDLGTKPNGQKFYNVRNANGQFVRKGAN